MRRRSEKAVGSQRKSGKQQGLKKASPRAEAVGGPNTLISRLKPEETPAEAIATLAVSGLVANAVTTVQFSKVLGDVDLTASVRALGSAVERVHHGDLRESEALLTAQTVTLNTLFTHLANLAAKTEYVDNLERYLRLGFKAQAQCRATLGTLAEIKNPPTLFARQANIAHGPQQVNNTVRVEERDSETTRAANPKNCAKRTIKGS